VPQLVVIVQIFVAQRERIHPLPDERLHGMREPRRIARVAEARGELR
jgi:hypothetical protein